MGKKPQTTIHSPRKTTYMLATTQKFPIIALAGAISFLANLTAFTIMTSPAQAHSQLSPAAISAPLGYTATLGSGTGSSGVTTL